MTIFWPFLAGFNNFLPFVETLATYINFNHFWQFGTIFWGLLAFFVQLWRLQSFCGVHPKKSQKKASLKRPNTKREKFTHPIPPTLIETTLYLKTSHLNGWLLDKLGRWTRGGIGASGGVPDSDP